MTKFNNLKTNSLTITNLINANIIAKEILLDDAIAGHLLVPVLMQV